MTSGIRLGTSAMTTRGFKEAEFENVAHWISLISHHPDDEEIRRTVKSEVRELMEEF